MSFSGTTSVQEQSDGENASENYKLHALQPTPPGGSSHHSLLTAAIKTLLSVKENTAAPLRNRTSASTTPHFPFHRTEPSRTATPPLRRPSPQRHHRRVHSAPRDVEVVEAHISDCRKR